MEFSWKHFTTLRNSPPIPSLSGAFIMKAGRSFWTCRDARRVFSLLMCCITLTDFHLWSCLASRTQIPLGRGACRFHCVAGIGLLAFRAEHLRVYS